MNDDNNSENENENIPVQKVHIYNNNRHLQKSNSAGNINLFFEPYYSELKNSTSNNLFNSKPLKKSILQIEYVNLPKINMHIIKENLPKPTAKPKYAFPDEPRTYNNYSINYYNNNSYGKNNNSYNRFPNLNNNYNYNNYGYNNRSNHGYDYNNYNNYGYRKKDLGELYSQMFLSRDNTNDMNSKIRNYYIKSIEQPYNYERKDNNKLFNYKRIRSNPRNYTFNNISRDDIIINDIKASRKYREIVFFLILSSSITHSLSLFVSMKSRSIRTICHPFL